MVVVMEVVVVEVLVVVRMSDIRQGPGVSQSFVFCPLSALKKLCEGQTDQRTNKPSCIDLIESVVDV